MGYTLTDDLRILGECWTHIFVKKGYFCANFLTEKYQMIALLKFRISAPDHSYIYLVLRDPLSLTEILAVPILSALLIYENAIFISSIVIAKFDLLFSIIYKINN